MDECSKCVCHLIIRNEWNQTRTNHQKKKEKKQSDLASSSSSSSPKSFVQFPINEQSNAIVCLILSWIQSTERIVWTQSATAPIHNIHTKLWLTGSQRIPCLRSNWTRRNYFWSSSFECITYSFVHRRLQLECNQILIVVLNRISNEKKKKIYMSNSNMLPTLATDETRGCFPIRLLLLLLLDFNSIAFILSACCRMHNFLERENRADIQREYACACHMSTIIYNIWMGMGLGTF